MKGIKHIEFWVSDLDKSILFYKEFFTVIGWEQVDPDRFKSGNTKIYFKQYTKPHVDSVGPRHICFWTETRDVVDQAGELLKKHGLKIIRGPIEMSGEFYSSGYYTVDFYDPDGYILEVAHASQR